jgi:hypothetical protein
LPAVFDELEDPAVPDAAATPSAPTTRGLVLTWRMLIDPSPLLDPADAGLTNR